MLLQVPMRTGRYEDTASDLQKHHTHSSDTGSCHDCCWPGCGPMLQGAKSETPVKDQARKKQYFNWFQRMIMICIIGPFVPGKGNIMTCHTGSKTYRGTFSEQQRTQCCLMVIQDTPRKRRQCWKTDRCLECKKTQKRPVWFSPAHQCELKLQSSELSRISSVIRLNSSSLFILPLQRFLGLIQSNGSLSWSHTVSSASYKKHEIIYQKIQNTVPALPSICHVSGQSTNVWAQYEWINIHRTPSCVTGGKSVHFPEAFS